MKLLPILLAAAAIQCRAELYHVYAGSYTGKGSTSQGITRLTFDTKTGELISAGTAAKAASPSFLVLNKEHTLLYAVNEDTSSASAYRVAGDGGLTLLNSLPAGDKPGAGPCHLCLIPEAGMLVVANYGGGSVATFALEKDGSLKALSGFHQHTGSGGNPSRQKEPHAHSAVLSPGGGYVLVNDLGTDQIYIYAVHPESKTLKLKSKTALKPGSGPRHGAFSPDGKTFYSLNELDSSVTSLTWDEASGSLKAGASVSTLPEGFKGNNSTAEIVTNGTFVYGSNRGHDSIAVFSVGAGGLKPLEHQLTGGKVPRNFTLSPDGKWLLSAHQASNDITVLPRAGDGTLGDAGKPVGLGKPVCLVFGGIIKQ